MTDPKDDILRYQELLRRDPHSRVFAPLAEACRKAGRLEEALSIARDGVAHHPNYAGGRVALGRALMALGRHAEAEAELARAVRASPGGSLGFRLLGEARARMGDRERAFEAFARALALNPEDDDARRGVMELDSLITGFRSVAATAMGAGEAELDLPLDAIDDAIEDEGSADEEPEAPSKIVYWELDDEDEAEASPAEAPQAPGAPSLDTPDELDLELLPEAEGELELELVAVGEEPEEGELELEFLDIAHSSLAPEAEEDAEPLAEVPDPPAAGHEAPPDLRTETLADLYVEQGHLDRAREVYRALIAENPLHLRARKKLHAITRPAEAPALPPGSPAERIAVLDRWLANIRRNARRESSRAIRARLPGDPNRGA